MTVVANEPANRWEGDELAARYARMAHDFRPQPVDAALRALDIVFASVALVALCVPLLVCGLAVLTSGRPILYRGARVGRAGRVFSMYKFRTLRPGAEQRLGPYLGDMSLVGPRPIRPLFFVELCVEIPAYWQRLVVRPGITGLAQLRLSREMTWAEKLVHDLEYIADRSVGLYLSILGQTLVFIGARVRG
jgi:lipopolysaccharide/colanic/teichoic acid biosynthesis glycosyltransferase